MRFKARWRSGPGKDKVKEASKRLRVILRTSHKLGVASDALDGLAAVSSLRTACRGRPEPSSWWFFSFLVLALLVGTVVLTLVCGVLPDILTCANNTSKEIQIQTIRLDRHSLDSSVEQAEESVLFNDSEDSEEGHLWQPASLRLRRER